MTAERAAKLEVLGFVWDPGAGKLGRKPGRKQGETDMGFRGFTRTPWASLAMRLHRVYGVF